MFAGDPARRQGLGLVTELGQGPSGWKGSARIAVYRLGRLMAHTSAGRATARLARVALPSPYRWLHTRYATYRNAAASLASMKGDLPSVPELPSSHPSALAQQERNGLSAEEQIMLFRLRARDAA